MKIIITPSQYNLLIKEQQTPPPGTGAAGLPTTTDKSGVTGVEGIRGGDWIGRPISYKSPPGPIEEWYNENKHIILPIAEIGAAILIPPPAGLIIAAGIGMVDAAGYLEEGDKQNGGISCYFCYITFCWKNTWSKTIISKSFKDII